MGTSVGLSGLLSPSPSSQLTEPAIIPSPFRQGGDRAGPGDGSWMGQLPPAL